MKSFILVKFTINSFKYTLINYIEKLKNTTIKVNPSLSFQKKKNTKIIT